MPVVGQGCDSLNDGYSCRLTGLPARAKHAEHKFYMDSSSTALFDDLRIAAKHQMDSNTSRATL